MKLIRFEMKDILGIHEFEADASGQFTEIRGDNATGKSSLIEGIKASFGANSVDYASLIRDGADRAESVLIFDSGHRLQTTIKENGKVERELTLDGNTVPAPKRFLDSLLNQTAFNPIDFVQADDKTRVAMLLKNAPMTMDVAAYKEAVGVPAWLQEASPFDNPLALIERTAKAIYTHRTGLNHTAKHSRAHAEELAKTIPGKFEEADPGKLQRDYDVHRKTVEGLLAGIEKLHVERKAKANAEYERKKNEAFAEMRTAIECSEQAKADDIKMVNSKERPLLDAELSAIGKAVEISNAAARIKETKASIHKANSEADKMEIEATKATDSLAALEILKAKLLESLPVPGLEIKECKLIYEGHQFATTNEAMKAKVALQLAAAISGKLKLVVMDGMERMGKAQAAAFVEEAKHMDCQFVLARMVDGEPLNVRTSANERTETEIHAGAGERPDEDGGLSF